MGLIGTQARCQMQAWVPLCSLIGGTGSGISNASFSAAGDPKALGKDGGQVQRSWGVRRHPRSSWEGRSASFPHADRQDLGTEPYTPKVLSLGQGWSLHSLPVKELLGGREGTCFSLVLVLRTSLTLSCGQHVCDRSLSENLLNICCYMLLSVSIITPQVSH